MREIDRMRYEIERLRAELSTLAEGNVERWERECAYAAEIDRLRAALEDALPCLGEHDPEVWDIAREALNKGEEK